jgi:hypothetical protein
MQAQQKAELIVRCTHSIGLTVTATAAVQLLKKNPYRIYYYIQNHDAANYIAIAPQATVTAGVFGHDEGTHIHANGDLDDEADQDEVWALANTDSVYVTVVEVSDVPSEMEEKYRKVGSVEPTVQKRIGRMF